ncbi:unnamed protein product [Musa textilis]
MVLSGSSTIDFLDLERRLDPLSCTVIQSIMSRQAEPPTEVSAGHLCATGFPRTPPLPSRSIPQEWLFEGGSVMGIKCDVTPGPEYYARMTSSPLLRSFTPAFDYPTSLLLCLTPRTCRVDHGTGLRGQVRIPPPDATGSAPSVRHI